MPAPTERGIRLVDQAAGPVLQVASDRYDHADGGEVWVRGTVHVADPVFFTVSVARLAEQERVLVEGLVDDVEPVPPTESGTAKVLGLQHQSDVDIDRPGWAVHDLAESELQARMRADGVAEDDIREMLVDAPGASRADLPDDDRGVALARLRYMRDLAVDETGPRWRRYMIEARDAHVAEAVTTSERSAVWYGADHLGGIGEHLSAAGWRHRERTWTPAIATTYSELELGPVQVRQLIQGWGAR